MLPARRMDDYAELAAQVAARVGGMRGCLVLSRDGLVLGAHPEGDDNVAKPSWLRFALLGEPERSFVEFADQVWCYVHRGPYAAFAVADRGVRPGLLMDRLEQALLTAEGSRSRREGLRAPEPAGTPAATTLAARLRSHLHPAASEEEPVIVPTAAPERPAEPRFAAGAAQPPRREWAPPPAGKGSPTQPVLPSATEPSEPVRHEPPKLMTMPVTPAGTTHEEDEAEVDRVMLAQEFGGLLQEPSPDDEATS